MSLVSVVNCQVVVSADHWPKGELTGVVCLSVMAKPR